MDRLFRALICLLAIGFAATGVNKIIGPDASWVQIAHGTLRVVFGAIIAVGAARELFERRPEATSADGRAEDAPDQTDPTP